MQPALTVRAAAFLSRCRSLARPEEQLGSGGVEELADFLAHEAADNCPQPRYHRPVGLLGVVNPAGVHGRESNYLGGLRRVRGAD